MQLLTKLTGKRSRKALSALFVSTLLLTMSVGGAMAQPTQAQQSDSFTDNVVGPLDDVASSAIGAPFWLEAYADGVEYVLDTAETAIDQAASGASNAENAGDDDDGWF